jgi:tetratricopeptide (TPR) repeat protein
VNVKPELSSYARVSYFRELHGDLAGALAAMQLAVTAGGGTAENVGYVQALVGKLHFDAGDYAAAENAYRSSLETDPGFPAATAGLARVEAAQGDYPVAIHRLRALIQRLPLPDYVIALGDTEQAAGMSAAAQRDYQLVGVETRLLQANGVNTDAELALFEADHGDASQAVDLAARAWAAAPSVRSADAYSWALSAAGRDGEALAMSAMAMRLGSRDPSFLYHAGMVALRSGHAGRAHAFLSRLVAQSPRFNPLYGPRAQRALEGLR